MRLRHDRSVRGRILASVDAAGNVVTREYGAFGEVSLATDAGGHESRTVVDRYGRPTWQTTPDSGTESFVYSAFGEVKSHADNAGRVSTWQYDRLGRRTSLLDEDGLTAWRYDGPGANAIGRMTESQSPDCVRTTYQYESAVGATAAGPQNRGLLAQGHAHDRRPRLYDGAALRRVRHAYAYRLPARGRAGACGGAPNRRIPSLPRLVCLKGQVRFSLVQRCPSLRESRVPPSIRAGTQGALSVSRMGIRRL
jgi:YD repeat-containing protein